MVVNISETYSDYSLHFQCTSVIRVLVLNSTNKKRNLRINFNLRMNFHRYFSNIILLDTFHSLKVINHCDMPSHSNQLTLYYEFAWMHRASPLLIVMTLCPIGITHILIIFMDWSVKIYRNEDLFCMIGCNKAFWYSFFQHIYLGVLLQILFHLLAVTYTKTLGNTRLHA